MKKIIIMTALMLILSVLCGCASVVVDIDENVTETKEIISETVDDVDVPDIVIKDDIYTDKTEYSSGAIAEIFITAPKAEADKCGETVDIFNQLVEMNVDSIKNEYLQDVAMNEGAEGTTSSSRMLTYETYYAQDGIVSVLLKYILKTGSSNTVTTYRAINFDLTDGKALSLTDIVNDSDIPTIKAKILTKMRENPNSYYSTEDGVLDNIDINYTFLVKGSSVYIYFDEYAIASRAAGMQIFEIKLNELG